MQHRQLLKTTLLLSCLINSLSALATKSTINVTVDNQSHRPYSLTIYGKGANYEIRDAFTTLPAHQSGNILISYQIKEDEDEPTVVSHTVVLSSKENNCAVNYSTHCQHPTPNYLAGHKLKAKVHSAVGPCHAVEQDENNIKIVITEEVITSPTPENSTKLNKSNS